MIVMWRIGSLLLCFPCCRAHGDTQHCRKALHRAVQCTSDYPEHVCEVLLTLERIEGSKLQVVSFYCPVPFYCQYRVSFDPVFCLLVKARFLLSTVAHASSSLFSSPFQAWFRVCWNWFGFSMPFGGIVWLKRGFCSAWILFSLKAVHLI